MKNLKRIMLMISMFALTGDYVNCSFRSQLERISANSLISHRELNEFCKLTQEDSDKVRSILNDDHENQHMFSDCFLNFINDYFNVLRSGDLYFDFTSITNTLVSNINFKQLRQIYLDSILSGIKFIRNIFEQEIVFNITFEINQELDIQIPLSVLLMFDFFEGIFDCCKRTSSFHFTTDYELSEDIKLLFEAMSEGRLEYIIEVERVTACNYLQINQTFISGFFVQDIENKTEAEIRIFAQVMHKILEMSV